MALGAFTLQLEQRNQKKDLSGTDESRGQVAADISKDISEMASVETGAEIAIARLEHMAAQHPGGPDVDHRIQEFQQVIMRASSIMAQLSGGGRIDLNAIAAAMASVETEFRYDESADAGAKDDKLADAPKAEAVAVEQRQREDLLLAEPPPVLFDLRQRDNALQGFRAENGELAKSARTDINDGAADLLAVVAIAGLLYEVQQKQAAAAGTTDRQDAETAPADAPEALAKAQAKLEKYKTEYVTGLTDSGLSEEAAKARLAQVSHHADAIQEGRNISDREAAGRMLDAVDALVIQPLHEHSRNVDAHLQSAGVHVNKHANDKQAGFFQKQSEMLDILNTGARDELTEKLRKARSDVETLVVEDGKQGKELLGELMDKAGVHGLMETASRYANDSARLLGNQVEIYEKLHEQNAVAEKGLIAVFTGAANNYRAAARKAGIEAPEEVKGVLTQVAAFRNSLKGELELQISSPGQLEKTAQQVMLKFAKGVAHA